LVRRPTSSATEPLYVSSCLTINPRGCWV